MLAGVLRAPSQEIEQPLAANLIRADASHVVHGRVAEKVARMTELPRAIGEVDILEVDEESLIEAVQRLKERPADKEVRADHLVDDPLSGSSSCVEPLPGDPPRKHLREAGHLGDEHP